MRVFSLLLLLGLTLNLSANLASSQTLQEDAPTVVEVPGFRVHVHIPSDDVAEQVRETVLKTWEVASDLYGAELSSKKLDVNLYRDKEGYLAVEEKLTKGRFKRNQAFAHFATKSAHVALQPFLTDAGLEDVGLPTLTAQLLAHETAHIIRYDHLDHSFRNHPTWFYHGMASWIDRKVVTELGLASDQLNDPKTGASIRNAKKLLADGKYPSVQAILDDEVEGLKFQENYDVYWIFVSSLFENHPKKMREFVRDSRRLGGGQGFAKRMADLLLETLEVDTDQLDQEVRDYLNSLCPVWVDEYRSLETAGDEWIQIGFPNTHAVTWHQTNQNEPFTVSTAATIHRGTKQQLNFRIGSKLDFVQISFTAGFGLNIFRFEDRNWTNLAGQRVEGIELGQSNLYSISVNQNEGKLRIEVDSKQIYEGEIEFPEECHVGLSVQNGAVVTWKDFRIKN
jgi:hypothetical protein